jgi:hypothetical protein
MTVGAELEKVIGEYYSQSDAERAIRWLERQQLSIQDVVVADLRRPTWRRLHSPQGHGFADWVNFAVVMRGERGDVERAERLLRAHAQA